MAGSTHTLSTLSAGQRHTSWWQMVAPVVVLIFLSPVITELLMGVVHLSNIWLLVPEMGVYGLAALLIREVVRRKGRGWGTILLLGFAFALTEECVILQTSLTPQFFPPAFDKNFGWAFGVQWIYLLAMLWYESVYAIVLPIYLTEMLFPQKRAALWLSRRGLIIAGVIFVLASTGVWQLWSRVGLQRYGPSTYHVPLLYIIAALSVIVTLIAVTLTIRQPSHSSQPNTRRTPAPWLVGFLSFGYWLAWFLLIALAYLPASTFPGLAPVIPIVAGLAWIALGLVIIQRISTTTTWDDRHRLAVIFGASLASMAGGTLVVLADTPVDIIGKFIIDLIAISLFLWFAARLRNRAAQ